MAAAGVAPGTAGVKSVLRCSKNCVTRVFGLDLPRRMILIKKYANRRLYDTDESRYITLEELAQRIRDGAQVRVVDAKSEEDLTQSTLTQIILESRGGARLLPVPLLMQLIRMGDDALAEFFNRYVTWSLELYLQAKQGVQSLMPFGPLSGLFPPWSMGAQTPPPVTGARTPEPPPSVTEMDALRRELEDLKKSVHAQQTDRARRR